MAEPWSEVTRPSESSDDAERTALTRELSLFDALMINVGITLGSAIFIVPAIIIANVGTAFMSGVVWIIAGVLSWFGAVTFAELAVMMLIIPTWGAWPAVCVLLLSRLVKELLKGEMILKRRSADDKGWTASNQMLASALIPLFLVCLVWISFGQLTMVGLIKRPQSCTTT